MEQYRELMHKKMAETDRKKMKKKESQHDGTFITAGNMAMSSGGVSKLSNPILILSCIGNFLQQNF
jgi:hypothetical protein